jgi:hypothetical protein
VWLTEAKKFIKKFWEMSYKNQTGETPDNDGQDIQRGIENSDAVNLTRWINFSIRRTFTMALLLGLLGMSIRTTAINLQNAVTILYSGGD